eukprot:5434116-Pleurochrysis_carterae.AAC.1
MRACIPWPASATPRLWASPWRATAGSARRAKSPSSWRQWPTSARPQIRHVKIGAKGRRSDQRSTYTFVRGYRGPLVDADRGFTWPSLIALLQAFRVCSALAIDQRGLREDLHCKLWVHRRR